MAKRSAEAAPAPAAPPPGANGGTGKAINFGTDLAPAPAVIEWDQGNGKSQFMAGELPPDAPAPTNPAEGPKEPDAPAPEKEETTDPDVAPAGADDDVAKPAEEPAAAAKPETPAPRRLTPEERRELLGSLERERNQRSLETEARTQRERAEKLEAESRRPLAERLRSLSQAEREQLLDMLLVGGGEAPAEPAAPSPEVAALKAEVAELKADRVARQQAEQDQHVQRALADVAESIKDAPTPLVHAIPGGYDLVLKTAHQAWIAAGRTRPMREFLPSAADVVEEHYREQHPRLAALTDAKAGAPPAPKATAAPGRAPATSIGKRTAARPDAKPEDLPADKYQRDAAIKKEFGWT